MIEFEYRSNFDPRKFSQSFRDKIARIIEDEALNAAVDLEKSSPVGASRTLGDPALADSWQIDPASRSKGGKEISLTIINTAPNALNRLEGRRSGKFPPPQPIRDWVRIVLKVPEKKVNSVAYLVARKIARQGTNRSKRNFREFDPATGEPAPNGAISRAIKRINRRIAALKP